MERPSAAPTLGCFSAPRDIPESALTALRGILRSSLSSTAPVPPARRQVPHHHRHASPPQRPRRHVTFDSQTACSDAAGITATTERLYIILASDVPNPSLLSLGALLHDLHMIQLSRDSRLILSLRFDGVPLRSEYDL